MNDIRSRIRIPATFNGRLAAITCLGLLIRLAYLILIAADNPLSGDAVGYHLAANVFGDGLSFPEPYRYYFGALDVIPLATGDLVVETPIGHIEPSAGHPPVWTMLLGTLSFLGFTSVAQQQVVSVLLGAPAIVLMGLLGREVRSERTGLLAATASAGYAFIWVNDGLMMAETAAIAMATATMLVAVRFWKEPSRRAAVILGIVGGLAALTRAELVLYLPLVAAVVLVRSALPWRERILRYTCCGVAALAICMPWFARNIATYDAPVFLSNGIGTVLVQANCDATYYGSDLGYWQVSCGNPPPYGPDGQILGEYERDLVVRQRASEYISANRSRLLTVVVPARVGRMWSVYEPIGQLRKDVLVDRRSMSVSLLGLAQFVVLVPLAVAGMVIVRRRRGPLLVLAAWIPIATFTAATTFGNTRYRTAAEASLVILAAVAADALLVRLHPNRTGRDQPVEASQPPGGSS